MELKRTTPLIAGAAIVIASLAGCAAASGQETPAGGLVTGKFIREGGPIGPGGQQPKVIRLSGLIEFTMPGQSPVKLHVGKSGKFTVMLPPGTYSVSGRTPSILEANGNGPGRETPCSRPLSVKITAGHTAKITVTCIVP